MFKKRYITPVKWFYGITESKAIDAIYSLDRSSLKRIVDAYKDETERANAKAKEERRRRKNER